MFVDSLKRFFSLNKKTLLIIFSVLLICVFTGIFCTVKMGQDFELNCIQNFLLNKFFCKKISVVGFLFLNLLFLFVLLFITYILSFTSKVGFILISIFLLYISFQLGVDITIIFINLGIIKGAIFGYIICLPCQLISIFLFFVFSIKLISLNKQMCRFGNSFIKNNEIKIIFFFFIILSVLITIQSIMFFLLSKFFIFM